MSAGGWSFPRCTTAEVYDGDTIRLLEIDLGLDTFVRKLRLRLLTVDAPELDEPGGPEAKAALQQLCPTGSRIHIYSSKWDRYARRIDGRAFLPDGRDLEELLLATGTVTLRRR